MAKRMMGDVLTAKEAARYVRLTLPTFYRYIWEGKIEAPKIGGRYRFTKSLLDRWLDKKISGAGDVDQAGCDHGADRCRHRCSQDYRRDHSECAGRTRASHRGHCDCLGQSDRGHDRERLTRSIDRPLASKRPARNSYRTYIIFSAEDATLRLEVREDSLLT